MESPTDQGPGEGPGLMAHVAGIAGRVLVEADFVGFIVCYAAGAWLSPEGGTWGAQRDGMV